MMYELFCMSERLWTASGAGTTVLSTTYLPIFILCLYLLDWFSHALIFFSRIPRVSALLYPSID